LPERMPTRLAPNSPTMSRKLKKGYFVKGQFVAEGSELDLELKRELKGTDEQSRTDLKRESTELQKLGEDLLNLHADLFDRLDLPEKLVDAVSEAKRISNFEGKRRQMQFIGKLMRQLDPARLADIRATLVEQHTPSARETKNLHESEQWRDRLIADDAAVAQWITTFPQTDTQQLRALVRQARKDAKPADKATVSQGLGPRQSRAYREIFQFVREHLAGGGDIPENDLPA
jgi:ribosome-associated protein